MRDDSPKRMRLVQRTSHESRILDVNADTAPTYIWNLLTRRNRPALSSPAELESTIAEAIFFGKESKVSLNELASVVQASPARTQETIRRLKRLGYPLHLSRAGVIERSPFRPIDPQQLSADLLTERIGRKVEWRLHVRSTQDELKNLENEAHDGTVLIAETQYAGRGRLTRSWFSAVGGIWMSVLLRPTWPRSHQILTLAFAAATAKAIRDVTKLSPMLKWPNDLMVRSRKVAGILAEAAYRGNQLDHFIVGLGINANIKMASFPVTLRKFSTSLSHELSQEIDRTALARRIIEEMDRSYCRFESGRTSELLDEAKQLSSTLGRRIRVTTVERSFVGYALDLGDEGQLLVRLRGGVTVPVYAADVVHLR
jgi:BirA family biotin operon repressor/biotin-[acetyl-CoA-carboxylase] ligase